MNPTPAEYHDPEHASSRESVRRHVGRYRAAIRLLRRSRLPIGAIVDCACGTGYGTELLARAFPARQIIGVDRSALAITTARTRYATENNEFYQMQVRQAGAWLRGIRPLAAVVCIETLEHLPRTRQVEWIKRVYRSLEPGGVFVLMCPTARRAGPNPRNPWHLHEPTATELRTTLTATGGTLEMGAPQRYTSTAGRTAWQATAVLRKP